MTNVDWALVVSNVAFMATAMWYQVRYYKLVDDLISALTQEENK